tara:strand:+ start:1536 stop:1943 length:408 start_codon:yes stop_codon:yes gene_type:complete
MNNDIFTSDSNFQIEVMALRGAHRYTLSLSTGHEIETFSIDTFHIDDNPVLSPYLMRMINIMYLNDDYSNEIINKNTFDKLEKISKPIVCPICMDTTYNNIKLNCEHTFCENCIKKWLMQKSNTCPNCRTEIKNK